MEKPGSTSCLQSFCTQREEQVISGWLDGNRDNEKVVQHCSETQIDPGKFIPSQQLDLNLRPSNWQQNIFANSGSDWPDVKTFFMRVAKIQIFQNLGQFFLLVLDVNKSRF